MTSTLQWARDYQTGYWYGDTPGLSDVNLRKAAAEEITKALQTGNDEYKIVFVITEEAGRVRPVDVTTITTVLNAIVDGGAVVRPKYGIIVNKVSKKKILRLRESEELSSNFYSCLQDKYVTSHIHLYAKNEELEDEDNIVHDITPELTNFLCGIPSMEIHPNKVHDVKVDDYEAEWEKQRKKFEKLKDNYDNQIRIYELEIAEQTQRLHDLKTMDVTIRRTRRYGGNGGDPFDDQNEFRGYGRISYINIFAGQYINKIGIGYADNKYVCHGRSDGHSHRILLRENEKIVKVTGKAGEYIDQISFHNQDGEIYGPFGGNGGDNFTADFKGNSLRYIFGRAGWWFDGIGFGYSDMKTNPIWDNETLTAVTPWSWFS